MDRDSIQEHLPLASMAFQVLLALADRDNHGYAIAKEIEANTGGRTRVGTGSLYLSMAKLADQGLIEACDPPAGCSDRRRRYYRITGLGREVGGAEASRLAELVALASRRRLLEGEG